MFGSVSAREAGRQRGGKYIEQISDQPWSRPCGRGLKRNIQLYSSEFYEGRKIQPAVTATGGSVKIDSSQN